MTLDNSLLRSFASITNNSTSSSDIKTGYGYAVTYQNPNKEYELAIIMDSNVKSEDLGILNGTDLIIDYYGTGSPQYKTITTRTKNDKNGVVEYETTNSYDYFDSNDNPLSLPAHKDNEEDLAINGGDLYLDQSTLNLYVSYKNTIETINDGAVSTVSDLRWRLMCVLVPADNAVCVNNGDRIIYTIKNHSVSITGNLSEKGDGSTIISIASIDINFSDYT